MLPFSSSKSDSNFSILKLSDVTIGFSANVEQYSELVWIPMQILLLRAEPMVSKASLLYKQNNDKKIHFNCYKHLANHNQQFFFSMIYDLIITLKLFAPIYAIGKSTYPPSVSYNKMYHNFLEAYLLLPAHLPYKN